MFFQFSFGWGFRYASYFRLTDFLNFFIVLLATLALLDLFVPTPSFIEMCSHIASVTRFPSFLFLPSGLSGDSWSRLFFRCCRIVVPRPYVVFTPVLFPGVMPC